MRAGFKYMRTESDTKKEAATQLKKIKDEEERLADEEEEKKYS